MRRIALLLTLALAACAGTPALGPPVPQAIELDRFGGKWYVVANIPASGERGKVGSWVEYSPPRDDGTFLEHYFAYERDFSGVARKDERVVQVTDPATRAQWRVAGPWTERVIGFVDPDYQQALMLDPGRERVWVLSRQKYLGDEHYEALRARLAQLGYDTQRVLKVPQRPEFIGAPGFQ